MESHNLEWLNLLVRWIHVISGVAWIGASFYFNWLEGALDRRLSKPGLEGELWAIHGGGFYHVVKHRVAPPELPEKLHWFKWEAYTTWVSGFSLLVIVYYLGARAFLIDPSVADLSPSTAISLSLASLVAAWFLYDALSRSLLGRRVLLFALVMFFLAVLAAYGFTQVFSSRAAYIHVGALLGTLMAANVFRVIIPSQKKLVEAMLAGAPPDAELGRRSLQRSLHNNYMTLPVLFIMISNHFPVTYGHRYNWLILAALTLIGAGTRHYFNLKNRGHRKVWILPAAALAMFGLALITKNNANHRLQGGETMATPDFATVAGIIDQRCRTCHSMHPSDPAFPSPPNGVVFDSPHAIQAKAALIRLRVVDTKTMPLANRTQMTDEERGILGAWIDAGAKLP